MCPYARSIQLHFSLYSWNPAEARSSGNQTFSESWELRGSFDLDSPQFLRIQSKKSKNCWRYLRCFHRNPNDFMANTRTPNDDWNMTISDCIAATLSDF